MFVVFDIDGTLADCTHRVHHIKRPETPTDVWPKQDWAAFHAGVDGDVAIGPIVLVARAMVDCGHQVEFWTGRSDACRAATEKWLADKGIGGLPVRMRTEGSHTADYQIKSKWIEEYGKPDLIFEDRKSVVDMWRAHGIICAQVAPGDF